jgi:phosphotransferase system HPr-like phosphotransfer protein
LGISITRASIASNAKVISSYVLDAEIEQLKKEEENKSPVQLIKADVTKEEEVEFQAQLMGMAVFMYWLMWLEVI